MAGFVYDFGPGVPYCSIRGGASESGGDSERDQACHYGSAVRSSHRKYFVSCWPYCLHDNLLYNFTVMKCNFLQKFLWSHFQVRWSVVRIRGQAIDAVILMQDSTEDKSHAASHAKL